MSAYPPLIAPTVAEAERIEAGGEIVPNEIAALLRHNADQVADLWHALKESREHAANLATDCNEMCARLDRLQTHLTTLADYAAGQGREDRSDPPQDPFPANGDEPCPQ